MYLTLIVFPLIIVQNVGKCVNCVFVWFETQGFWWFLTNWLNAPKIHYWLQKMVIVTKFIFFHQQAKQSAQYVVPSILFQFKHFIVWLRWLASYCATLNMATIQNHTAFHQKLIKSKDGEDKYLQHFKWTLKLLLRNCKLDLSYDLTYGLSDKMK